MPRYRFATVMSLLFVMPAMAERVPLSPAELQKESTHVVIGVVKTKYGKDVTTKLYGPGTIETNYVLEIEVESVEKGDEIKPKDIVYARCWRLKQHGALGLVPGPSGHGIPADGAKVRAYLARGQYSATGQSDRGFALVFPNGCETLPK